jgi:hypothetical protein
VVRGRVACAYARLRQGDQALAQPRPPECAPRRSFSAEGDVVISIDADLQDDVAAIEPMLDAYAAGNEIVYGVRKSRESDTPFKRGTAKGFYGLLRRMGVEAISDHATIG